jgi:hypothetical protein
MTALHRATLIVLLVLFVAVASGLIVRRRWRLCGFFDAYIASPLIFIPMLSWWTHQFWRQWFVLTVETALDVFKFGIAIELVCRTFRPFPGARSTALLGALGILAVTLLAATAVPISADAWEWEIVIGQLFPRVKTGTLWLMAMTLLTARWYHIPVHPFHTAVLTSFVTYVALTSGLLWLQSADVETPPAYGLRRSILDAASMATDLLAACYWVHIAWRPDSARVVAHRETLRKLETEFSSCG